MKNTDHSTQSKYQPVSAIYQAIYGVGISHSTVSRNRANGLKCVFIGGRWLSTPDDVQEYENAKSQTAKKIAPEILKVRTAKARERAQRVDSEYLDASGV